MEEIGSESQETTRDFRLRLSSEYAELKQLHIIHKEHQKSRVWTRALRLHHGKIFLLVSITTEKS